MFGLLTHNLLIELFTTARENLFDVLPCFGRRLKALVDTVLSSELNSAVEIDFSGRLQLAFVTDEVDAHILCSMLLDLLQPTAQVLECLITRDVVSEENAMSAAIKYPSYRLERLLTSGVPDLELDDFVVYLETIRAEFDSNCDLMLFLELIVHDTFHEAGFANTCITDDD